jgi:uncharacterized surface protein with fasciclin (FAS1) repeats
MRNSLKALLILPLLAMTMVIMPSCEDDDDPIIDSLDLVGLAQSDARFTTLVAALTAADLVGTLQGPGPFTVFAPTNEAFDDFLAANGFASLDDIPTDVLTSVLLNHVVSGELMSGDLSDGYANTLATGPGDNAISILIGTTGGVSLNGDVNVTEADLDADNGVIHVVDQVIGIPNVVDFALDNPGTFSSLVAALTRSDLTVDFVSILVGDGPFTVFAPTNDAFQALLDSNPDWDTLDDIDVATLEAVLSYHVVAVQAQSGDLSNGQTLTMFGSGDTEVSIDGNTVSIIDANAGTANVVVANVQGSNGVVHAIDAVLLP